MMHGPIRRIPRDRAEPRDQARLPTAWVGREPKPARTPSLTWLSHRAPVSAKVEPPGPVLVMLGDDSAAARAELLACAATGARVYAIVGPTWGKGQADAQVLQAPRVLVRRLAEVPASSVHGPGGARVWLGGGFDLRLDAPQTEALRQTFLRLFWHEASEEAWSGGRQFAWRSAGERPFDVPEVPPSAPVRTDMHDASLGGDVRGALLHLAGGPPPEVAPRRLWFPAGASHHEQLAKLARAGTEVVWDDRGLPDAVIGNGGGEVLLPGTRGRLRIRLNAAQASDLAQLLEGDGRWRFLTDVRVGDPAVRSASFWLAGESAARGLEVEQVVDVPDVTASSVRSTAEAAPSSVPSAQPLALAVRYRWTAIPPRVPAGTDEDPLVDRWRKMDEEWSARLARARDALIAAEGERGRISRAFSRLVSAMLGFQRAHSGLLAQIASLEAQRPSAAGPSGAPALLGRLADLEDQARKLQADLEDAERKAREDEEREKQEAAWRGRVAAANRDLPARRAELTSAEARLTTLSEELASIDEELKAADKAATKDLAARQRRLSDELTRAKKDVSRLRDEVAGLEQQAAERFEFRPPAPPSRGAPSGGRFVPATSTRAQPKVPDEALPEVGSLRSHKGQRYLVIQTWEELALGEQAAARLSAQLVAPESA